MGRSAGRDNANSGSENGRSASSNAGSSTSKPSSGRSINHDKKPSNSEKSIASGIKNVVSKTAPAASQPVPQPRHPHHPHPKKHSFWGKPREEAPVTVINHITVNQVSDQSYATAQPYADTQTQAQQQQTAASQEPKQRLTSDQRQHLREYRAYLKGEKLTDGSNAQTANAADPMDPAASANSSAATANRPLSDPYNFGVGLFGCLGAILLPIIIVPLFILFLHLVGVSLDGEMIKRPPLNATSISTTSTAPTSYFTDKGDWIDDSKGLNAAMKDFYKQTGVKPFLYIMANGSTITEHSASFYGPYHSYKDKDYFTLVFCDNDKGGYDIAIDLGEKAESFMAGEPLEIFESTLEENYYDFDLTETEIFANTYRESAQQIMDLEVVNQAHAARIVFGGVGIAWAIVIIVCIILLIRHSKKKRDAQRQAKVDEMLSQPLEKYSDDYAEELAKKYEQTPE